MAALALFAACSNPDPPWQAVASPTAPKAAPEARPATAATLLREAVTVGPTGALARLSLKDVARVDPLSAFRVVLTRRCLDARISLIDAGDAVVPAEAERDVDETTTLLLRPNEKLSSNFAYVLRLDGAAASELHDSSGVAYPPLEFRVLADLEVPAYPVPPNQR